MRPASPKSARTPVGREMLRQRLDELVATFDVSTIEPDPLQLVRRYDDPLDQEVAGLIAASFAYGRADVIVRNIGALLDQMQPSPFRSVAAFDPAEAYERFDGFAYRFHKTADLVAFLARISVEAPPVRATTMADIERRRAGKPEDRGGCHRMMLAMDDVGRVLEVIEIVDDRNAMRARLGGDVAEARRKDYGAVPELTKASCDVLGVELTASPQREFTAREENASDEEGPATRP